MQYIDKTKNEADASKIINELFDDAWSNGDNKYIGADYYGLKNRKYKDRIIPIHLKEQDYFCCYCMRLINETSITLEHVIPQSPSNDFNKYLDSVPIFKEKLVLSSEFDYSTKVFTKFPHDVSYHNLIGACSKCNNERGNDFVTPITYDIDILNKIEYEKNGLVSVIDDKINIDKLSLNNRSLLVIARQLWFWLAKTHNNINEIADIEVSECILKSIPEDNILEAIEEFMDTEDAIEKERFNKLMEFKWFFKLYRTKHFE